jgi:outer membrane protein insertion porin family
MIGLFSCNTTKFLRSDEILLKSNKIQIEGTRSIENKLQISEQLSTLYKQKPNRKYFLIPRERIHYYVQNRKNKDSWFVKTLAKYSEPPSILDTSLCNTTKKNIITYLFNQGYFNASCDYKIKIKNQKATVTYIVNPGERHFINNVKFVAEDSLVHKIINEHEEASFLQQGLPLDFNLFQNEKARISELLFNHGFVEFNPIYIQTLEVDTIHRKANIVLQITNPDNRSHHPQYKINTIDVNPFYLPNDSLDYEQIKFESITFHTLPYFTFIKNKVIASNILFRPGDIANKSLVDQSYEKLSRLGIYRFINIEAKIDTAEALKINYNILLRPLKKWVLDFGGDFNYTSIRTVSKSLFGISGFVHLKNRNLFKGAESFSTKLEVGTELNLLKLSNFNSFNIHYSNELSLPAFYDITGTLGLARMFTKKIDELQSKSHTRTNIRLGIDYENLTNFYNYASINANIEYDWQIHRRKRISLHTFGFSLYVPETTPTFNELLKNNPFLENSFKGRRLFTSYLLDNFAFYYQTKPKNNIQHSLISNFNISGFEVYTLNSIYNKISNSNSVFSLGEFEFSKFIRPEFDYRFYYNFSEKSKLASRFSIGIIVPFGSSNSVPYIKQFYSGGPQSLRAWNIRELGPGSLNLSDSVRENQTFFAAGDFKLEANIEYRFDIVWRLKGALFLDAGNIWLLPKAENKNQAGFLSSSFLNEIAIGTGMGFRLDLSYFLFRVDVGFKLRNSYRDDVYNKHWIFHDKYPVSLKHLFQNYTVHLALDYPF